MVTLGLSDTGVVLATLILAITQLVCIPKALPFPRETTVPYRALAPD